VVSGSGHLGLLEPTDTDPPLSVNLVQVPFNLPRIRAIADGTLTISGSLRDVQMGGDLGIERGVINAQRGRLAPTRPGQAPAAPRKGVAQLLQENWDFKSPLLLVGAEVESNTSQDVLQAVPRFSVLGFNDLRLRLGPDLRIVVPNAASFTTAGLLRLSGRLDPTLRARGVVRLLQGRLNLFTTSFSLDPDAPNVAVFTPALGLIPYLDIAYQGSGDGIEEDAFAIRAIGDAGLTAFVANSFSKSMSLYGERAGALSVVCESADEAALVLGQMKATVRRNYSSPPTHGGQITAAVMSQPELHALWVGEVTEMRTRIKAMRQKLFEVLSAKVPGRDFGYFINQRGMFSYTGFTPEQVDRLREEFAVYLVRSGRMCVAGLNSRNVDYVADAMAAVLKG
jgi:hypothetical protein